MNSESRRVPPCISCLALCLLTIFSKTLTAEAAPVFEPIQAFELSPKNPWAKLIQGGDGDYYGTSSSGGSSGMGTVFKMTPGGAMTTLVNFTGANGNAPQAGLIEGLDGNFYGTTSGGNSAYGTVFRMTPDGVLTTLASFTGIDGSKPRAGLVQGIDGNFYGTTSEGGSVAKGTAYKLTPTGTLTTLVHFTGSNGSNPEGSLIQANDGNFYGTTLKGGSNSGNSYGGDGTAFRMSPDGTLTTLANFMLANGRAPTGGLIQGNDGILYGTTTYGGSEGSGGGYGTIFKMTPGGELTTLVNFTDYSGIWPLAGLVQASNGNFYGTTSHGNSKGPGGRGTIFKMTPGGTLSLLANFNHFNGSSPQAALIQGYDGNLYGTTFKGGSGAGSNSTGDGTIFQITPQAILTKDSAVITLVNFADVHGREPLGKLVQGTDGNLYGTTSKGGGSGHGTVFKMTHAGLLTNLVNFTKANGSFPEVGLVQGSDGSFYGTTRGGGDFNYGTIFKMTPSGSLTTLVSFADNNGRYPGEELIQGNDGNFYGTTYLWLH